MKTVCHCYSFISILSFQEWQEDLAEIADRRARLCSFAPDPNVLFRGRRKGEIMEYFDRNSTSFRGTVEGWVSEGGNRFNQVCESIIIYQLCMVYIGWLHATTLYFTFWSGNAGWKFCRRLCRLLLSNPRRRKQESQRCHPGHLQLSTRLRLPASTVHRGRVVLPLPRRRTRMRAAKPLRWEMLGCMS